MLSLIRTRHPNPQRMWLLLVMCAQMCVADYRDAALPSDKWAYRLVGPRSEAGEGVLQVLAPSEAEWGTVCGSSTAAQERPAAHRDRWLSTEDPAAAGGEGGAGGGGDSTRVFFTESSALIACRSAGFLATKVAVAQRAPPYFNSDDATPIFLSDVRCPETVKDDAAALWLHEWCGYVAHVHAAPQRKPQCTHADDVYLRCGETQDVVTREVRDVAEALAAVPGDERTARRRSAVELDVVDTSDLSGLPTWAVLVTGSSMSEDNVKAALYNLIYVPLTATNVSRITDAVGGASAPRRYAYWNVSFSDSDGSSMFGGSILEAREAMAQLLKSDSVRNANSNIYEVRTVSAAALGAPPLPSASQPLSSVAFDVQWPSPGNFPGMTQANVSYRNAGWLAARVGAQNLEGGGVCNVTRSTAERTALAASICTSMGLPSVPATLIPNFGRHPNLAITVSHVAPTTCTVSSYTDKLNDCTEADVYGIMCGGLPEELLSDSGFCVSLTSLTSSLSMAAQHVPSGAQRHVAEQDVLTAESTAELRRVLQAAAEDTTGSWGGPCATAEFGCASCLAAGDCSYCTSTGVCAAAGAFDSGSGCLFANVYTSSCPTSDEECSTYNSNCTQCAQSGCVACFGGGDMYCSGTASTCQAPRGDQTATSRSQCASIISCRTYDTDCRKCTSVSSCGYCGATGRCLLGSNAGPSGAVCNSSWIKSSFSCIADVCGNYLGCKSCLQSVEGAAGRCAYCSVSQRCVNASQLSSWSCPAANRSLTVSVCPFPSQAQCQSAPSGCRSCIDLGCSYCGATGQCFSPAMSSPPLCADVHLAHCLVPSAAECAQFWYSCSSCVNNNCSYCLTTAGVVCTNASSSCRNAVESANSSTQCSLIDSCRQHDPDCEECTSSLSCRYCASSGRCVSYSSSSSSMCNVSWTQSSSQCTERDPCRAFSSCKACVTGVDGGVCSYCSASSTCRRTASYELYGTCDASSMVRTAAACPVPSQSFCTQYDYRCGACISNGCVYCASTSRCLSPTAATSCAASLLYNTSCPVPLASFCSGFSCSSCVDYGCTYCVTTTDRLCANASSSCRRAVQTANVSGQCSLIDSCRQYDNDCEECTSQSCQYCPSTRRCVSYSSSSSSMCNVSWTQSSSQCTERDPCRAFSSCKACVTGVDGGVCSYCSASSTCRRTVWFEMYGTCDESAMQTTAEACCNGYASSCSGCVYNDCTFCLSRTGAVCTNASNSCRDDVQTAIVSAQCSLIDSCRQYDHDCEECTSFYSCRYCESSRRCVSFLISNLSMCNVSWTQSSSQCTERDPCRALEGCKACVTGVDGGVCSYCSASSTCRRTVWFEMYGTCDASSMVRTAAACPVPSQSFCTLYDYRCGACILLGCVYCASTSRCLSPTAATSCAASFLYNTSCPELSASFCRGYTSFSCRTCVYIGCVYCVGGGAVLCTNTTAMCSDGLWTAYGSSVTCAAVIQSIGLQRVRQAARQHLGLPEYRVKLIAGGTYGRATALATDYFSRVCFYVDHGYEFKDNTTTYHYSPVDVMYQLWGMNNKAWSSFGVGSLANASEYFSYFLGSNNYRPPRRKVVNATVLSLNITSVTVKPAEVLSAIVRRLYLDPQDVTIVSVTADTAPSGGQARVMTAQAAAVSTVTLQFMFPVDAEAAYWMAANGTLLGGAVVPAGRLAAPPPPPPPSMTAVPTRAPLVTPQPTAVVTPNASAAPSTSMQPVTLPVATLTAAPLASGQPGTTTPGPATVEANSTHAPTAAGQNNTTSTFADDEGGASVGVIAGAVVGSLLGTAGAVFLVYRCVLQRRGVVKGSARRRRFDDDYVMTVAGSGGMASDFATFEEMLLQEPTTQDRCVDDDDLA